MRNLSLLIIFAIGITFELLFKKSKPIPKESAYYFFIQYDCYMKDGAEAVVVASDEESAKRFIYNRYRSRTNTGKVKPTHIIYAQRISRDAFNMHKTIEVVENKFYIVED